MIDAPTTTTPDAETLDRRYDPNPMRHQGLVVSIAARFLGRGLDLDDLTSEGNIGLLRAGQLYDPNWLVRDPETGAERRVMFSTYAAYHIRNEIQRAVFYQGRSIVVPVWVHELVCSRKFDETTLTRGQRRAVEAARLVTKVSRYGEAGTPIEHIKGPASEPDWNEVGPEIARLRLALSELADIESEVIRRHFGIGVDPQTLTAIGTALGISRETVRKIVARALRSLRDAIVPRSATAVIRDTFIARRESA